MLSKALDYLFQVHLMIHCFTSKDILRTIENTILVVEHEANWSIQIYVKVVIAHI